jgi:prophage antirepressor-like protein
MSALSVFAFGEQVVRVSDRNGSPWFVGRDVCSALALKNPWQSLSRLPDDEKGLLNVEGLGGKQEMIIISEAGMYRLVLTSRTEPAERFKTWVVSEVLPSIRRTGGYVLPAANDLAEEDEAAIFKTERGCGEINAKVGLVRAAGRTFGPMAAQEAWRRIGLIDVDRAASPHYNRAGDEGIGQWFAARIDRAPEAKTRLDAVYNDYLVWCRRNGVVARALPVLIRELRLFGAYIPPATVRLVHGLQLRELQSILSDVQANPQNGCRLNKSLADGVPGCR